MGKRNVFSRVNKNGHSRFAQNNALSQKTAANKSWTNESWKPFNTNPHSHRTQSICTDTSCFGGRKKKSGKLEQMNGVPEKKNARKIKPGFAKNKNIVSGWRNNKIRRTTTKKWNDAKLARRHTTVFQLSQVCQLVGPKNSAKWWNGTDYLVCIGFFFLFSAPVELKSPTTAAEISVSKEVSIKK